MTARLQEIATKQGINLAIVDASAIATEVQGVPINNTAIIGAIVKATNLCQIASLEQLLEKRFGRLASKNRATSNRL